MADNLKEMNNNFKYIVMKPRADEKIMYEVVAYSKDQKAYEKAVKELFALELKSKGVLKISESWRIPLWRK